MHIHLPKPLHGWREFLGEVGIIVIGVLIALGAENILERRHWQRQTQETREALKLEMLDGATNAWERLVVGQCLRTRLSDLFERMSASDGSWQGSPMLRQTVVGGAPIIVTPAYAPPSRIYQTDAWKNALANGSFNHLPVKDAAAFSEVFTGLAELDRIQADEAAAATKLAPLSFDRHLDERARADMIATIAEVDRNLALIKLTSQEALEVVQRMHLGFDRKQVQDARARTLAAQRRYRGPCVQALPLDLG